MTLPVILLTVFAVGAALLFSILRITRGGVVSLLTKTLASFCFVALGVVVVCQHPLSDVGMFLLLGLIAGMIGDILLDLKSVDQTRGKSYLNYGMVAFGVGHIFYILFVAFVCGENIAVEAIIAGVFTLLFTLAIVFFSKQMLGITLDNFVMQAGAYCCVLSFASAFAVAIACSTPFVWPFAIALVCFWISDIILSIMYFGGKADNKFLSIANHVLYYGAQIAIALFMVML